MVESGGRGSYLLTNELNLVGQKKGKKGTM